MANRTVSVRLQAEIGSYVSSMARAAAATRRLGDSTDDTSRRARGGFDVAGKGALLLGGAIVAGFAMAISKSMEFEKSMSGVAAATGATGSTLLALRDAAMEAGAATQYSATEAADAIREMAKAGVSAADIMGGGLKGALNLAAAGQLDVAKAAEIASVAMTQFGLTGNQLPHVADLLAAGAGKAMGSVEDMGMALNQAGLVASATGLSIEETTGTLAAFASAGLVGSDAGTSFRSMLQHLQNPSKESAAVMAALGVNMYDANGQFVGMSTLAGQLKTTMSGLTQAERDKAMATIFGSDAVRAANVLYTQGAQGIEDWTTKVDDAGYAQKQAAALTDNLSGDLERLGGSFDTLMIALGEGAQGPLRALMQAFTGLLDMGGSVIEFWQSLPGPVQATVVGLAAVVALQGPLAGFWVALQVRAALAASALLGAALSANLLYSSLLVLPLALAAFGIANAVKEVVDFTHAGNDARAIIESINESIKASDGNQSHFIAVANGVRKARDEMADFQAVVSGFDDQNWFDKFIWKNPFHSDVDVTDARKSIDILQGKLDELEGAQERANQSTMRLGKSFGMTREEVVALADKYGIDLNGSVSESRRLFENFYAMEYGAKPTEATLAVATAMEDVKAAADEAKTAIDNFKLSLDILTGAHVDMATAEAAFYAAVDEAKGALEGLDGATLTAAGSLNVQSEAGRQAQEILHGVRDASNTLSATMIQQGDAADVVIAKDAEMRAGFIKSAMDMGISETAANGLANQILGIPSEREAKIRADVAQAQADIAETQRQIDSLRDRTVTITTRHLNQTFDQQMGRTYYGQIREFAATGGGVVGGHIQHFDIGGGVYGPGGPTSDRVPAMLSNGEHVWTSAEVNAAGGQEAVAAMRRAVLSGREFSGGGPGGGSSAVDINRLANSIASILASRPTVGSITTQRNETGFELAERLSFTARTGG